MLPTYGTSFPRKSIHYLHLEIWVCLGSFWVRFFVESLFLGEKWGKLGSFCIKRSICRGFSTVVEDLTN